MSGRRPPLYCTLILITMRSHQSYPNISTVIHSYEYSTNVDNSAIETYRNRGLGKYRSSNLYTSILYNFINFHARVLYKHTEYTGSLGYNSVCYITSRIRWVFKEKSEQMYPVMGKTKTKTFRWDQMLQSFQGKIRTLQYI